MICEMNFCLFFYRLPEVCVEGGFRDVTVNMNLLVAVALTDDAPAALLQIARPPRTVEVVERHEPVLHVHTGTHLEGAAHEDAHLTGAHLCKQLLLPRLGVGLVDEGDLPRGGIPLATSFFTDVVVYREAGFVGVFPCRSAARRR